MSRSKKSTKDIHASFPTCGEVFHFVVTALDLHQWRDMWNPEKRPDELKTVRLWKSEEREVPSRNDFSDALSNWLPDHPLIDNAFKVIVVDLWEHLLEDHCRLVKHTPAFLSKQETRQWNAACSVYSALTRMFVLQKVLLRTIQKPVCDSQKNPVLETSLHDLLEKIRASSNRYPVTKMCVETYPFDKSEGVDANAAKEWRAGKHQPLFASLNKVYTNEKQRLEIVFNFAFARLVERVVESCRAVLSKDTQEEFFALVIRETEMFDKVEEALETGAKDLPLDVYYKYPVGSVDILMSRIQEVLDDPACDERIKGMWLEASRRRMQQFCMIPPPDGFDEYVKYLRALCNRSGEIVGGKETDSEKREALFSEIKEAGKEVERVFVKDCLNGLVRVAEAHMALIEAPGQLDVVLELYDQAVNESLYSAGAIAEGVIKEAFTFVAFMHRNSVEGEAKKTLHAWLERRLKQWDLLGFGPDFDHEQQDQRFERAARLFSSQVSSEIQEKMQKAFSGFKPKYFACGDTNIMISDKAVELNHETGKWDIAPLNPRRKGTIPDNDSLVGRKQTVLMEALDREDFKLATERVRNGEDLNFVNSTGDTALTKALTKKQYPLVLEMLQRQTNPISLNTVLRNSDKFGYSLIRNSIDHGQMEFLREVFRRYPLVKWSDRIIVAKCDGRSDEWMTPLYYCVNLLGRQRLPIAVQAKKIVECFPPEVIARHPTLSFEGCVSAILKNEDWTPHNPDGVLGCVKFLVNEANVNLDTPHVRGHSALTLSVEDRLHDVALMLLEAGANVNHRIDTGATALVYSIGNNDVRMARLLLEYKADRSFQVYMFDKCGKPCWRGHIYEMPMSDEMRRVIVR